jgi:ribosomal protein S18 acetylase RimI-like enzyme
VTAPLRTLPPLEIRPYTDGDLEPLVRLWSACNLLVPYNDPDHDIALWRATESAEIFVGEARGEIVASVCAGHDGHRGWLYYVAVAPHLQGCGAGRAMVGHAELWLKKRGVAKVQLMVRHTNLAVRGFYEAIGYTLTPRLVLARWLREPAVGVAEGGRLSNTITYLEMRARPTRPLAPAPHGIPVALLRAQSPSVPFYRFLYDSVGAPWLWYERRQIDDTALAAIIQDPMVEVYVLYAYGEPAGYVELDRRSEPDIEVAYFGLRPQFIGRGLGPFLLDSGIDIAWRYGPSRLWLHTNTMDHPKALATYQRAGFVPYDQRTVVIDEPRASGLL